MTLLLLWVTSGVLSLRSSLLWLRGSSPSLGQAGFCSSFLPKPPPVMIIFMVMDIFRVIALVLVVELWLILVQVLIVGIPI